MADSPVATPGPSPSPAPPQTMADILPEKPPVDDRGMVTIGHLHVQGSLYGNFREAMLYDAKNPETTTIVEHLVDGPRDTTVLKTLEPGARTHPELEGGSTVHWNPNSMMIDAEGGRHSAAVIVGHELVHAERNNRDDFGYDHDTDMKDVPPFTNREEKRVVQGWENATSRILGEGVRHDNGKGQFIESKGVTSLEPVLHQTRNGNTSEIRSGYSQTGKITEITERDVSQQIRGGEHVKYPFNELAAVTYPGTLRVGETLNVAMHGREISARELPSHGPNEISR